MQSRQGAPPRGPPQPQIDQAVLDSLDPADRAAVLAAQFGDSAEGAPAAGTQQHEPPPPEDMPAFAVDGSLEQLQADLGVATDNVGVLDELMAAEAPPELLEEVVRRCRAMRAAVHRAIDRVKDESALDHAVQVRSRARAVAWHAALALRVVHDAPTWLQVHTELTRVLQEYDARTARDARAVQGESNSREGAYVATGAPGRDAAPLAPQPSGEYAPFQYPAPTDVSSSFGDGSQPLRQDPAFSLLGSPPRGRLGEAPHAANNPFAPPPPAAAAAAPAPDLINFDAAEESRPAAAPDASDPFAALHAGGTTHGPGADPFNGPELGVSQQDEPSRPAVAGAHDVTDAMAALGTGLQAPPPPGPSI